MVNFWRGAKGVRTKYNARHVSCELGGRHHTHDSMAERDRCHVLHVKQELGEISCLTVHNRYKLAVRGVEITTYEDDFAYLIVDKDLNADLVVEDVKSPPTRKLEPYQIKKALMKATLGIEILETS